MDLGYNEAHASELASALMTLFTTHGDCPVFHEEQGSDEVCIQPATWFSPSGEYQGLVPEGTIYFLIH